VIVEKKIGKVLSADAQPFKPSDFPPLRTMWETPLTPKIYEEKNTTLQKELMETKVTIVRLEKRCSWFEKKKDDYKRSSDKKIVEITDVASEYEKVIMDLEKTRDDIAKEMRNLRNENAREIENLRNENARMKRRSRLALEQVDEVRKDFSEQLRIGRGVHLEEINKLRGEVNIAQLVVQEKESMIINLRAQVSQLRSDAEGDWIGRALKYKLIFDKMVLPEDHAEWVVPMVEEIEFPNTPFVGDNEWIGRALKLRFILGEAQKVGAIHDEWSMKMADSIYFPHVSMSIRDRFLPTYNDAHMIDDGSEVEQAERIAEWSHEADDIDLNEEFTNILVSDRPLAIIYLTRIQSLIRGFVARRRLYKLYGDNPQERIQLAIKIQKVFRGFIQRAPRFQELSNVDWYTNSDFARRGGLLTGPLRASDRRGIQYINTSSEKMVVNWIRSDGTLSRGTIIPPRTANPIGISTFATHCFSISIEGNAPEKFIRIPRCFKSGNVFDVSTGLCFTREFWNVRKENEARRWAGVAVPEEGPLPRGSTRVCDCGTCQRRRLEEEEEEENIRIQLAVQMSLEQMWIDDTPDFGEEIESLFE